MRSTGVVRKIDELGRFVLPIELRRNYELNIRDGVEIYTDEDIIILKKFQRTCVFCNNPDNIVEYKGRAICSKCIEDLKLV